MRTPSFVNCVESVSCSLGMTPIHWSSIFPWHRDTDERAYGVRKNVVALPQNICNMSKTRNIVQYIVHVCECIGLKMDGVLVRQPTCQQCIRITPLYIFYRIETYTIFSPLQPPPPHANSGSPESLLRLAHKCAAHRHFKDCCC